MAEIETSPLVRITKFVSPEYSIKYLRHQEGGDVDRPGTYVYSDPPEEDRITDWINNNALVKIDSPIPGRFSGDPPGYVFVGENGSYNVLSVEKDDKTDTSWMRMPQKEIVYQKILTIRTQPAKFALPEELSHSLEGMGYTLLED